MHTERRSIECGARGAVSAVIAYPDDFTPGDVTAVILAHGAGNDMSNPLLHAVHEGLATRGFLSVKFNFLYTERGRHAPDPAPVLEECYRSVVEAIRTDASLAPSALVIGGKSMGGRMASHLAAHGAPVQGLLLLGYPLHPAGQPHRLRVAHLGAITVPMLFLAGTRDALCSLDLLRDTLRSLSRATLHVIDGGDHSFKVPKMLKRSQADVVDELIDVSTRWLRDIGQPDSMEVRDGR